MTDNLWARIETPDGHFVPGPHSVGDRCEIYPGISAGVSLIVSGGEALLMDPGWRTAPHLPTGVLDVVCDLLNRSRAELRYILQTHWHYDHTGNTQYIKDRFGGELLSHPVERSVLEDPLEVACPEYIQRLGGNPDEIAQDLGLPDVDSVIMPADRIREYWNFPMEVDRTIEDGETLSIGELELTVLHTPGHTPGHLSLFNPTSKSLYLNDVMYWPTPLHPHPVGDAQAQIESVLKCLELKAEYLFPGHELPRCGQIDVEDYLEDLLIKSLQVSARLRLILKRHGALDIQQLHPEVFVLKDRYDYDHGGRYVYGQNCIQAHLRRLEALGEVARTVTSDGGAIWELTEEGEGAAGDVSVAGGYERGLELLEQARAHRGQNRG